MRFFFKKMQWLLVSLKTSERIVNATLNEMCHDFPLGSVVFIWVRCLCIHSPSCIYFFTLLVMNCNGVSTNSGFQILILQGS